MDEKSIMGKLIDRFEKEKLPSGTLVCLDDDVKKLENRIYKLCEALKGKEQLIEKIKETFIETLDIEECNGCETSWWK